MSAIATVERWSDYACAGGVALGALDVLDGTYGDALDSSDACSITIRHDPRVAVALREVLRITDAVGVVREYRVQSRSKTLANAQRTLTGLSPLADLGTSGKVRTISGGVTRYDVGAILTATQIIDGVVLTNLAADGLSWWSRGTVEPTQTVTLTAPGEGWSRLEWLRGIADSTGGELRARRVGETGYALDLLTATGSTAVLMPLALGRTLLELTDKDDDSEGATAITVYGATPSGQATPAGIGENAWRIGTITGAGPYWVPLTDPAGGAGPIAFASQFGTATGSAAGYLLTRTGTTTQITDSRISPDVAVQVAATTGLTAGELVQIVADSSATRLTELRTPNVSRLFRTDTLSTVRGERNLAENGDLATWTSATALPSWTVQGGTLPYAIYPRDTPTSFSGLVVNGGFASGASSVSIRGFPPFARLYCDEQFSITGLSIPPTVSEYVLADASGVLTFVPQSNTSNAAADGTAVTAFATGPQRPASFPTDNASRAVLRPAKGFIGTTTVPDPASLRLQSTAYRVKYVSGLPYVNASMAFTLRNAATSSLTGVHLPALALRDNVAGTILSSVRAATIALGATSHQIITCEKLLSADTTVDVSLWGGPSGFYFAGGSALPCFVGIRWVTMWLSSSSGSEIPPPLGDAPYGNLLWQRGNRALLARTLTTRQITATLRDLSTAAGYSVSRESLVLGGTLPLTDLGVSVRIVAIEYNPLDPSDVRVLLDSRPTALAKFLAAKV